MRKALVLWKACITSLRMYQQADFPGATLANESRQLLVADMHRGSNKL